jgi:ribosomal protein S18 acetylase RimI-like enzyme
VNAELVAVASVLPEQMPSTGESNGWRLRGMATLPNYRGLEIGRQLANLCVQHAQQMGGCYLWCTARIATKRFYADLGFVEFGEAFKLTQFSDSAYVRMQRRLSNTPDALLEA